MTECESKNCNAACSNDGGDTISCCECPKKGCFPSSAKVYLENGKSATMSELQIGDQVQTGNKNILR